MNYKKYKENKNIQMRDFFINKISQHIKKNKKIIFLSNDQGAQSLDDFRVKYKSNYINAGISEQNIISLSAGLSSSGYKVFVYSIASFITLRCFEQIKIDLNIMNLPVTILGVGASCSYDTAGPTHHSIEDIAILRTMPNLNIYSPSDNNVLEKIFQKCIISKNPSYVRLDRENLSNLGKCSKKDAAVGFRVFGKKSKVCIVSTGITTHIANEVKAHLAILNIEILIIDLFNIKNFNKKIFLNKLNYSNTVISLEENFVNGGIGSILSELFTDKNIKKKLIRRGLVSNDLYNYNSRLVIQKKNKIDKSSIIKLIKNL